MKSRDTSFSRRTFLQGTAAATIAALAARRSFSQATQPEKKLGFAFVGIGSLTKGQLLPALARCKYVKPVAFVTGHAEQNKALAAQYGIDAKNIYNYDNYDTIKDNPEVDVIYIVLPNSMHAEYTIRGAKAGKHILCEKPMATSVEDCQKMIDACKSAGKKLMIAYRMQYEPLTRKLIRIARDKNQVGDIQTITADCSSNRNNNNYDQVSRIQKPLSGGGALMDMGIYALQSTRYLTGEEPVSLTTTRFDPPDGGTTGPFRDVERNIVFDLKYPSGAAATVSSSYAVSANRTQLVGTKASLDLNPLMNYTGNKAFITPVGGARTPIDYTAANHFATEMDDFAQCVMNDKQSKTPGEEGLRDMKIITAAYESARSKQTIKLA